MWPAHLHAFLWDLPEIFAQIKFMPLSSMKFDGSETELYKKQCRDTDNFTTTICVNSLSEGAKLSRGKMREMMLFGGFQSPAKSVTGLYSALPVMAA